MTRPCPETVTLTGPVTRPSRESRPPTPPRDGQTYPGTEKRTAGRVGRGGSGRVYESYLYFVRRKVPGSTKVIYSDKRSTRHPRCRRRGLVTLTTLLPFRPHLCRLPVFGGAGAFSTVVNFRGGTVFDERFTVVNVDRVEKGPRRYKT